MDIVQVYQMNQQSIIAYNKLNEPEPLGFDKHFTPTCVWEHSYRHDNYDIKLWNVKICAFERVQWLSSKSGSSLSKIFKIKITKHLRRYTAPARGSVIWKNCLKNEPLSSESISNLIEFFQLNNIRYRTGKRAKPITIWRN